MRTFKTILSVILALALALPQMVSCSDEARDILLTSDKTWEDIVKEKPFMSEFPKYGGKIQTLLNPAPTTVAFTDTASEAEAETYYGLLDGAGFQKTAKEYDGYTQYTYTKNIGSAVYTFIGSWQKSKNSSGTFQLLFQVED